MEWAVAAGVAIHSCKERLPKMMTDTLEHVKSQATSSITIDSSDSAIQITIIRYMRAQSVSAANEDEDGEGEFATPSTPWLKLHGQHDNLDSDGTSSPVPGSLERFFWYEKTLFMLNIPADQDAQQSNNNSDDYTCVKMTVRCFGHSNVAINNFIEFIKKETETSTTLNVYMVAIDAPSVIETRDKRSMSTIDMEPKMRDKITQVVSDFFHPGTRKACKASGAPYRMGFLLSEPPGTSKTSLSVAIASHVSVPLILINLQGMDDRDLAEAFAGLPYHCVILLEDIDASSADVRERKKFTSRSDDLSHAQDEPTEIESADLAFARNGLEGALEKGFSMLRQQQETALTLMREDQKTSNRELVGMLKQCLDAKVLSRPNMVPAEPKPTQPKKITMSGLLNVIDGAASIEGRLLIMTSNHPDDLDEALARLGHCDHRFPYRIRYESQR